MSTVAAAPPITAGPFLTPEEAAIYLRMTRRQIYYLLEKGAISSIQFAEAGHRALHRIPIPELLEYCRVTSLIPDASALIPLLPLHLFATAHPPTGE